MMEMPGMLGPCKGKDFDTGTVIGPCIVTADEIDPDNVAMIVRINGEEVSRGSSRDMYHKFEDCIEHVTRNESLHPGELIGSGTVGMGSGFERFSFLSPGDVIELEVEGIGVLRNRVVPGPERRNPNPIKTDPSVKGEWSDIGLKKWPFEKGLHKITDGIHAWLAPDGSWGLSNAGLVTDGNRSLLIDTLYDLKLTGEMLQAMKEAAPEAASQINTLVNTHGDGDHWFGNELLKEAEIIASTQAAEHMRAMGPPMMSLLVNLLAKAPTALGRMVNKAFAKYRFEGITPTYPTTLVDDRATLEIGRKKVELIVVGPAHTQGDMLVYVPEDRVLFSGDIVFAGGTPVVHSGPIGRYIDALKAILEMDVEVIVPGHGPITDKRGASAMIAYLEYIRQEANKRFGAGMTILKTTRDIDLKEFEGWHDPDRLVFNVIAAYREYSGFTEEGFPTEKLFLLSEVGDY
jgi:glyoxylase-like metal-dependent hydrolase (beta-lactamase superfamily II)